MSPWLLLVVAMAQEPGPPGPPPSEGACWGEGVWTPHGASGAHPDGCNTRSCRDGRWTSMTLAACEIRILERVAFGDGGVEVSETGRAQVDRVAAALVAHPELEVVVVGHRTAGEAAAVGPARAEAVRARLVAQGVAVERLTVRDAGDAEPLVGPDDPTFDAVQRRVSFEVVPNP